MSAKRPQPTSQVHSYLHPNRHDVTWNSKIFERCSSSFVLLRRTTERSEQSMKATLFVEEESFLYNAQLSLVMKLMCVYTLLLSEACLPIAHSRAGIIWLKSNLWRNLSDLQMDERVKSCRLVPER